MATKAIKKDQGGKPRREETPAAVAPVIELVPIDQITTHPQNPRVFGRNDRKAADLVELSQSIRDKGVLEPILVRAFEDGYQLVAGERRWRAAKLAGLATIPAIVRTFDDRETVEVLMVENLQRKDLSPMEEAQGVKGLLDGAGWTEADVAAKLGKSLGWVAARVRLADLSPRWRKALADPDSPVSEWPLGSLLVVARLEPGAQDALADSERWLDSDRPTLPTRAEVTHAVANALRALTLAPWKLADAALHPDAGACTACPKRSSCHPSLFDDDAEATTNAPDQCLDPLCWDEKSRRHVAAREASLRQKHPNLIRLCGQGGRTHDQGVRGHWEVQDVKKSDDGAIPALVVDGKGLGSLRWVRPYNYGGPSARKERPKDADGNTLPTPLSQRREDLQRRRIMRAVELVRKALTAIAPYPRPAHALLPLTEILVPLVATFGTAHKEDSSQFQRVRYPEDYDPADDDAETTDEDLPEPTHVNLWQECDGFAKDPETACAALWAQIKPVLAARLAYQGTGTDMVKLQADAERICAFIGLDYSAAATEAERLIPQPKAWARLQEDGTKAPTKGRASRGAQGQEASAG